MNKNSRVILAKNIMKLRVSKKLTKETLSLSLAFENSYISKVENCRINITLERLDKIADYFGVKTFELLK